VSEIESGTTSPGWTWMKGY